MIVTMFRIFIIKLKDNLNNRIRISNTELDPDLAARTKQILIGNPDF